MIVIVYLTIKLHTGPDASKRIHPRFHSEISVQTEAT